MKFKDILQEKRKENENKLDLTDSVHKGLLGWVKDYIIMRHYGKTPFKEIEKFKNKIDKEIKRLKLNKKEVFFYYGDIDDPEQREKVMDRIGIGK